MNMLWACKTMLLVFLIILTVLCFILLLAVVGREVKLIPKKIFLSTLLSFIMVVIGAVFLIIWHAVED